MVHASCTWTTQVVSWSDARWYGVERIEMLYNGKSWYKIHRRASKVIFVWRQLYTRRPYNYKGCDLWLRLVTSRWTSLTTLYQWKVIVCMFCIERDVHHHHHPQQVRASRARRCRSVYNGKLDCLQQSQLDVFRRLVLAERKCLKTDGVVSQRDFNMIHVLDSSQRTRVTRYIK